MNDLATTHPEIAAQWATDNGRLTARDVTAGSAVKVNWWCTRHDYTWPAKVFDRTTRHHGCPVCGSHVVLQGHNDLATTRPDVAKYWVPVDGEPAPTEVTAGSGALMHWACTNGLPHKFSRTVAKRSNNDHCPICTHHLLQTGFNDLATLYPAFAHEWVTQLNDVAPDLVMPGNKRRWWLCHNSHLTQQTVPNRKKTGGCSKCPKQQRAMYVTE